MRSLETEILFAIACEEQGFWTSHTGSFRKVSLDVPLGLGATYHAEIIHQPKNRIVENGNAL